MDTRRLTKASASSSTNKNKDPQASPQWDSQASLPPVAQDIDPRDRVR
jgi:hypothetical protein